MNAIESLAIVGGGITGLSAAYYAKRANPQLEITLIEASDRLGGVVQTEHREGYRIEQSADSFLATPEMPWARQLVVDLGLEDQLIGTRPEARRALVLFRQRFHPVPAGFNLMGTTKSFPILRSSLLSWKGKWRLLQEPRVPQRAPADREESLADFATRRVGREAYERLVQPLSAGIYAADPTQLSIDAALPQFVEMEQTFGSLAKGLAQRNRDAPSVSGARYSKFLSLREGLGQLVERLVTRLQDMGVKLETQLTVTQIDRPSRWRVSAGLKTQHADALILACPPKPIRAMIGELDPTLAQLLESIPSATLAIVCLAYKRAQLETWPVASGFVVPAVESKGLIATSFASQKFEGRAPEGHVLLRAFLGGANHPEMLELDDGQLVVSAHDQLAQMLRISGGPHHSTVARWQDASPQYHLGHLQRVERIGAQVAQHPGLVLAGNSYNGVGLPQCIRSARHALRDLGLDPSL